MGAALEATKGIIDAFEAQDWGRVRQYVTDDFVFINPNAVVSPEASADEWLGFNQMMAAAFSDLNYNFEILEEDGDQAWVAFAFEGTFDGELDLSPLGMGVIAPTGKHGRAGRSVSVGIVNADGKFESIEVTEDEGGGLPELLAAVGVDMG